MGGYSSMQISWLKYKGDAYDEVNRDSQVPSPKALGRCFIELLGAFKVHSGETMKAIRVLNCMTSMMNVLGISMDAFFDIQLRSKWSYDSLKNFSPISPIVQTSDSSQAEVGHHSVVRDAVTPSVKPEISDGSARTWRVGGVLAVSRAFGDRLLKQYLIALLYMLFMVNSFLESSFYYKLRLLKNYNFLNVPPFSKIMRNMIRGKDFRGYS